MNRIVTTWLTLLTLTVALLAYYGLQPPAKSPVHFGAAPSGYFNNVTASQSLYLPAYTLNSVLVMSDAGTNPVTNVAPSTALVPLVAQGSTLPPAYASQSFYAQEYPSIHGLTEWTVQADLATGAAAMSTGAGYGARIFCNATNPETISNIVMQMTAAGNTLTAAATTSITNAVNNGSGAIRLTVGTAGATGDVQTIAGVVGTTEANGAWVVTNINGTTEDLNNSTFTNAYSSGGTATTSGNACAMYHATGSPLFMTATGDLVATWTGSTGTLTIPWATAVTLTPGSQYEVICISRGTTGPTLNNAALGPMNIGLSAANLRSFNNPNTGSTKLQSSPTFSSNTTAGPHMFFWALN